jgi:hypothetical protein
LLPPEQTCIFRSNEDEEDEEDEDDEPEEESAEDEPGRLRE